MARENITWTDFMKSDDEAKRDLLVQRIQPESIEWDEIRQRMSALAFDMGLKNPAPLYRVAYNVGALTMPEELAEEKERLRQSKKIKLARRAHAEMQPESAQAAPAEESSPMHAFLASGDSLEGRVASLESTVREMAEELKLLRRVILLMKS